MAVINTNVKALFSQSALKRTEGAMSNAMAQLSTGKRINTAGDDAAGLAIATRMTHQIRSLNQAVRNAGDAINLIQTAEGATNEITDMMQRMRELAIQAVNDTNENAQRSYLDLEFQQLKQEIVHISESTQWNGFPVLNGTAGERVGEIRQRRAAPRARRACRGSAEHAARGSHARCALDRQPSRDSCHVVFLVPRSGLPGNLRAVVIDRLAVVGERHAVDDLGPTLKDGSALRQAKLLEKSHYRTHARE